MISNTNKFEQLPEEKQSRIVNASISEFAEKDYETASMNTPFLNLRKRIMKLHP